MTASGSNDHAVKDTYLADDAGTATSDDANEGQHSDSAAFEILAPITVDKSITGSGPTGFNIPGEPVYYEISITNSDPTYNAVSVTLYDEVPNDVTYNSGSLSCPSGFDDEYNDAAKGSVPGAGWSGSETSPVNHVQCTNGTVDKSSSATMSFNVIIVE